MKSSNLICGANSCGICREIKAIDSLALENHFLFILEK